MTSCSNVSKKSETDHGNFELVNSSIKKEDNILEFTTDHNSDTPVIVSELNTKSKGKNEKHYSSALMSQSEIIKDLSVKENLSFTEARIKLFPEENNFKKLVDIKESEKKYSIISGVPSEYSKSYEHLDSFGKIFFYVQVTSSQNFRAIEKILYALYNPEKDVFAGTLQYNLIDANRIHYTLNGGLYSDTGIIISDIGETNLYESSFLNYSLATKSKLTKSLFIDKDIVF